MINDFEIGLPSKLPTKKDDLLGFSFNFENLIKTIDYLHKYNLALFSKLQNFNKRMIKFEEISAEFPKLKEIVENLQLYSKEHEGLIKENKNKINENENKINENETKIKKNENKINELSEQIQLNKNNITKNKELINNNNKNIEILLNDKKEEIKEEKVSDENLKKEGEKIDFEEIKKYINENVFQGKQDKEIDSIKDKINKINERLDDLQINLDSSKNELERNIYNLINSLQNNGDSSFQLNINNKSGDANLFKIAMAQIEKNKLYTQENIDKFSTNQEKLKQDVSWLKNDVSENKKNYQELQELVDEYLEDKKYYLTYKDIKETIKNVDVLFSKIKDFSSFSDIEILKSDINIRFQQISSKLKDLEELKTKNSKSQEKEGWDPEDLNFVPVTKRITELIHDLLKSEGKNIDLSKNKHFIELMKLNQHNSSELNKNMKNYLDLKTLISSNITNKDLEILKKDLSEVKNEFKWYKSKISEIIQLIGGLESNNEDNKEEERQKEKLKDKIEGEKYVENKIKQSEETIKGKIEFLTDYVEDLGTKMMKTEKKLNSITKDLKDDMKANLRLDTFKVVEQFKLKLNSFTDKFENELKNKIDKMGLNIFENKLNSKLNMDLKDKLNRNDLKKNNFMINKKIDTLENKISKTLVDTIIDLQMDDAPLLLKKNQKNFEICASCNRPLNDNNNIPSKTIEHTQMSTSPNFLLTSRIKNISSLKKLPVILNSPK